MSEPCRGRAPEWHPEECARLILEGIEDFAVLALDPEGHVESWNRGAALLHGFPAAEIVGQHFGRLYPAEALAAGQPARDLSEAAARGRLAVDGWRLRKDGSPCFARVVLAALRDGAGRLRGFSQVARDLTGQRRAEESLRQGEERYRLMVESVQDYAIFLLDPQGLVVTWNAGAERIKGWRAGEIVGQHFSRFYPAEEVAAGKPGRELRTALEQGRFEDEGWRVRKDGTRFWANVVVTALRAPSGEPSGFTKVTRDLTERREAEAERVRRARAEEAVRLRDEFLAIAAHELNTPLAALHLQLQTLQRLGPGLDPGAARRVGRALRSSQRLSELVAELLDSSHLATRRFELKRLPVALAEVVREVADRYREAAAAAGCALTVAVEDEAHGVWDRLRLGQVVTNLLANAVKYSPARPVLLQVAREAGEAVLAVEDRGPGIPEEALARIFGRFERADPVHNYGGLGLGLYVSREIVSAHGGTIAARNLPGGGARFTVRLPLSPLDGGAAA